MRARAATSVTDFNSLSFNNSSNNLIGASCQASGFTFTSSELFFVYGKNHASHPGSGAVCPTPSALITITPAERLASNSCAADVAGHENMSIFILPDLSS